MIDETKIEEETLKIIESIITEIHNPRVLLTGEYLVIPPTYHILAISVLSVLYGITGHFPNIIVLEKVEGGANLYLPQEKLLNLDGLRDVGREIRPN